MKYPRIAHVPFSNITDPDDIISDKNIFGMEWILTEKLDGSQMGIQFINNVLEARNRNTKLLSGSMDSQFHILPQWINKNYAALWDMLENRYIMFGEWLFHVHTVRYNALPDWFIGFDLYDKFTNDFIPFFKGRQYMRLHGISFVPVIDVVTLKDKKHLLSYITRSNFGCEEMEGIVLHSSDGKYRFKYVTARFKKSVDESMHWRACKRERNALSRKIRGSCSQSK